MPRRAQRGSEDGALLVGTGKDLLEATAAHVIIEKYGHYSNQANFPTLLGQAFIALGLATPQTPTQAGEAPQRRVERSLYEAGCTVNALAIRPAPATADHLCRLCRTTKRAPRCN